MSNSTDDELPVDTVDDELAAVTDHIDRLEERLDALEEQVHAGDDGGDYDADGGIGDLWTAVNELRHEHMHRHDLLTDGLLPYLRQEISLLRSVREKMHYYGEIMRRVQQNRRRIEQVETALTEKIDHSTFNAFQQEEDAQDRDVQRDIATLRARLDHIAAQVDGEDPDSIAVEDG